MLKKTLYALLLAVIILVQAQTAIKIITKIKLLFLAHYSTREIVLNVLTENGLFLILFLMALFLTGYYLIRGRRAEALAAQVLPLLGKPIGMLLWWICLFMIYGFAVFNPKTFTPATDFNGHPIEKITTF